METTQRLLNFARDNRAEDIKALISAGVNVNDGNQMGQTALHIAALWGNVEAARILIALGADVNSMNARGTTPLHFASTAKANAREMCELLLSAGAEKKCIDMSGRAPFECTSDPELRKLLGGPDPQFFDNCQEGKVEEVKKMLEAQMVPSVKIYDSEGCTPLNLAVHAKSKPVIELLLAHDPTALAHPDGHGVTALHLAVEENDLDLVQYLIGKGAPLDSQTFNTSEYAGGDWIRGSEDIEPWDKTALHVAVDEGNKKMVEVLLKAGAKPNILNFDGCSALHEALQMGDEELLGLLLEHQADANQKNKDFTSPLHYAASRGKVSMLELLLRHGADVKLADAQGWTPLHLATRSKNLEKVRRLVEAGADVNSGNLQGNTPLHVAALSGAVEVVSLLLQAGANKEIPNKEGKLPLAVAKTPEVERLLSS